MRTPEVNELRMKGYHPEDYINNSQVIRDVMARMYNGINGATFEEVANSIRNKDFYMALADFDSYRGTQHYISEVYRNQLEWNKKSLYNIAGAGRFSCRPRSYRLRKRHLEPQVIENVIFQAACRGCMAAALTAFFPYYNLRGEIHGKTDF